LNKEINDIENYDKNDKNSSYAENIKNEEYNRNNKIINNKEKEEDLFKKSFSLSNNENKYIEKKDDKKFCFCQ